MYSHNYVFTHIFTVSAWRWIAQWLLGQVVPLPWFSVTAWTHCFCSIIANVNGMKKRLNIIRNIISRSWASSEAFQSSLGHTSRHAAAVLSCLLLSGNAHLFLALLSQSQVPSVSELVRELRGAPQRFFIVAKGAHLQGMLHLGGGKHLAPCLELFCPHPGRPRWLPTMLPPAGFTPTSRLLLF